MPTAQTVKNTELSEDAFAILQTAVDLARNLQIRTLDSLRGRLLTIYPGEEDLIKEALLFWGRSVQERHPNGVSRFERD